jgi:hypothetical protein
MGGRRLGGGHLGREGRDSARRFLVGSSDLGVSVCLVTERRSGRKRQLEMTQRTIMTSNCSLE